MPTSAFHPVAVIGGGASGLALCCMLAQRGVSALLLEKQERVGRKLLATGNGRCNLTNCHLNEENYHAAPGLLRAALEAFPPETAVAFFESLGVDCVADAEGRVYPRSNQAAGVLDALRLYADENGVTTLTGFEVSSIRRSGRGFEIASADGRHERAERVAVCCGGLAAPKLGGCGDGYALLKAFGHGVTPRLPAIAPLKTDPEAVRSLKGIRARGVITLLSNGKPLRAEAGEILFNDGVISGIAAMQLAREVNLRLASGAKCFVELNFLPDRDSSALRRRREALPGRLADDLLTGVVPKRLGQLIMKRSGVPLTSEARALSDAQLSAIWRNLTALRFEIRGTQGFDAAQVTCGGVKTNEFDAQTLQSKLCPGLYAAGELLDVDGDCGGYNLHWAWASANLVCRAIAGES